ncbi:MAG: cysteine hydrolase [Bacteroidetes bacterium HGW-Bacteroidetes-4]|nr:MAG: cysteine hydrolase [Bacteroidetes bacterium HGW-Bacteroidetes-4]
MLLLLLLPFVLNAQSATNNSKKTALLLVDIQNFYFPGDGPGLVNAEGASRNAKKVLELFRENQKLVVHIRHKANKGFDIHENVLPLAQEKVITKTEVNSFLGTDLLHYLQSNGIERLVLVGMQTHMCLEAAVRAAHDYGFECTVIEDACATKDLSFNNQVIKASDVHLSTLNTLASGGYAKILSLSVFIENKDQFFK